MTTPKQLMVFSAIVDILTIFADTEIGGQYEINHEAIASYLNSFKMGFDYFDCSTKEEVYERFTEDIYNGFPVWRMLILPTWTLNMVEKSFTTECQDELAQMQKKYKCLTCKYYNPIETQLGILSRCDYRSKQILPKTVGREHRVKERSKPFSLKRQCKNYVPKE